MIEVGILPGISTRCAIMLDEGEEYEESASREDGPKAKIPYVCAWRDRISLRNELMGFYQGVQPFGATLIKYPHRHFDDPDMVCMSISRTKGLGLKDRPSHVLDIYNQALVVAEYGIIRSENESNPNQQLDPDDPVTACEMSVRVAGRMVAIQEGTLELINPEGLPGTPQPFNGTFSKVQVDAEIECKFPKVAYLPWKKFNKYLGKINKVAMLGCDKNTLLFIGMDTELIVKANGELGQSVSLKFLWQSLSWNVIYNKAGDERLVRYKNTSVFPDKYPFQPADLHLIFR